METPATAMDLTPEQFARLNQWFDEALDLALPERAALLEEMRRKEGGEIADRLALLLEANDQATETIGDPSVRLPQPGILQEAGAFREGELILDRFRIVRLLGRGGMGEVYEARDRELGPVALKTIRREMLGDRAMLRRFKQEVQLARQVTSSYVCRIHELFMLPDDGQQRVAAFLTMELLDGATLARRIEQGPLPWSETEPIAIELCQGLEALHAAGLVHRDFKPGNAMLARRGNVTQAVVMDLGLALRPDESRHGQAHLTLAGGIVGTPGYMAPEQFEGGKVSAATDIYALGLVLYEMTTGKRAFQASTPLAAAVKRAKRPPKVSSMHLGLPRRLDGIIEKCLEFEPADRFGSAEAVAKALRGGHPVSGEPLDAARTPSRIVPGHVPKQIGDFQLVRLLGRGGMGAVYEAYEQSMRRTVALKILDSGIDPSANELSRFEREAWIAGRLNHPSIVKALSQGEESGIRYMAMELVDGGSLATEIGAAKDDAGRHASDSKWHGARIRKMVSLFVGVADALQHVHENNIIHRDIKPQNLLLTEDGSRLLLTDFGLARDAQASQLTRRGDFLGTIRYMSPEQLLAQRAQVDRRTDIWSLGMSLYEAVTLDVPYTGASEEAFITAIGMRQPLAARERNPAVPRDLETILMMCLERDPEQRYGSAAKLREDLQHFLQDEPVLARRPGPVVKLARAGKRHRKALVAAILSAITLLALAVVMVRWQRERSEDERIRWVLQRSIATRSDPQTLDPGWEHLVERLRSELRRSPTGELAILANRAAIRIEARLLAAFGLLSAPPDFGFGFSKVITLGGTYLFLADLEGSLDGGPWTPIGSVVVNNGFASNGSFERSNPVTRYFPGIDPSPHKIDIRATCRVLNTAAFSSKELQEIFKEPASHNANISCIGCGGSVNPWPALRKPEKWLYTETRPVEVLSITLFNGEYPKDFPHMISQIPGKAMDAYFHVTRIRILRLTLPQSPSSGIRFRWPAEHQASYCLARNEIPLGRTVGVDIFGRVDAIPVPLAVDATLYRDGSAAALLSFPLAFRAERGNNALYRPEAGTEGDDNWTRLHFSLSSVASSPDALRTPDIEDIAGHLTLTPSRSVALSTRAFEMYYAQPLSIPVRIEIQTVTAEAVDVKSCQQTSH